MFCPSCQTEYGTGITSCSDCDVALVDSLGQVHSVDSNGVATDGTLDYVVVSTVQGQFVEGQICSFLKANGIPAEIRGEAIRKTYGIAVDGIGAAEILVPKKFASAARDLLARADRGELKIEERSE